MSEQSDIPATLFLGKLPRGQATSFFHHYLTHAVLDRISGMGRMTIEILSWPNLQERNVLDVRIDSGSASL